MPIVAQRSHGVHAWGSITYTATVNFAPGLVHAQVCLTQVDGEGLHHAGIKWFSARPDPRGPETVTDFGGWPWPSIVGVIDQMSSVTFGLVLGARQEARCRCDIYWWG